MRVYNPIHPVRTATLVVAANDSSAKSKAQADYVCDGTDDQVEIQAAIDALPAGGGTIALLEGTFTKGATTISVPSNVEIAMTPGTTITYPDNLDVDAQMFVNSDAVSGNTNIVIQGGVLDGNRDNQSAGSQSAIQFTRVSNSKVDCWIRNMRTRNIDETGSTGYLEGSNYFTNREWPNVERIEPTLGRILKHPRLELMDSLDAGWTQQFGTITYDTDVKIQGVASMKMVTPVGSDGQAFKNVTLDLRRKRLAFFYRFDNWEDILAVYVYIYSGAPSIGFAMDFAASGNKRVREGNNIWCLHSMNLDGQTLAGYDTVDWSSITKIMLRVRPKAGKSVTVWWDAFYIFEPTFETALVTFSFDDGNEADYTVAKKILDKYSYPGVSAIHQVAVGAPGRLTLSQMRRLSQAGWDICPHGYEHSALSELTESEIEEVILKVQSTFRSWGFVKGSRFFHGPGGANGTADNLETAEIVKKYYHFYITPIGSQGTYHNFPIFNPMFIDAVMNGSVAQVKTCIDYAVQNQGWLNIKYHKIDTEPTPAEFEEIVDYVYNSGARVVTFSDVLDKYLSTEPAKVSISDHFQDCIVASTNHVHAGIVGTGAEQEIVAGITNPDVPRNISITNSANSTGDVTIEGIDAKGNSVSEAITIVTGGTAYGSVAFSTVSKIIIPATVVNPDTIEVGISDKLGLSNVIYATGDVYKVKVNNADKTGEFDMAADVDTTNDMLDMSSLTAGAITGGDDITISFRSNLNIIS